MSEAKQTLTDIETVAKQSLLDVALHGGEKADARVAAATALLHHARTELPHQAIAIEREACAKLCEAFAESQMDQMQRHAGRKLAGDIRARGK